MEPAPDAGAGLTIQGTSPSKNSKGRWVVPQHLQEEIFSEVAQASGIQLISCPGFPVID